MHVSVIIPVYKVAAHLRACLESVQAQTFTDFEVVMVNDGSPDNCGAICDDFAAHDSRFRTLHQSNQGVSAARKNGLLASKAPFVTFLDADDYVAPTYIEALVKAQATHGADLVVVQNYNVREGEAPREHFRPVRGVFRGQAIRQLLATNALADRQTRLSGLPAFTWGKLYARHLIDQSIDTCQGLTLGEDVAMTQATLYRAHCVVVLPDYLYYYVERTGQATQKADLEILFPAYLNTWQRMADIDHEHLQTDQLRLRMWLILRSKLQCLSHQLPPYPTFRKALAQLVETPFFYNRVLAQPHRSAITIIDHLRLLLLRHRCYRLWYELLKRGWG